MTKFALPTKWTTEKTTGNVRWVRRNGKRVLQQYWAVTTHERVIDVEQIAGLHGEWRDVPEEAE